jgi:hypothetical protein
MKEILLKISEETENQIRQLAEFWEIGGEDIFAETLAKCVDLISAQMPLVGSQPGQSSRVLTQEEWDAKVTHHCTTIIDGQNFILEYDAEKGINLIPVIVEDQDSYCYPLKAHE